jgi:predicted hydrolase (HD superfamily)
VRPTGLEGMKPKSVRKKMKQPSFAAAVPRDQLERGAEELGVEMNEHIQLVIDALSERADELGLGPREATEEVPP